MCRVLTSAILTVTGILWLVPATAQDLALIPDLPAIWGNSSRAGFKETGEADPVIYIVDTLTHDAPVSDGSRNGIPVRQGGFKSIINEWEASDTPGIILFEISGTIEWTTPDVEYLSNNTHGLSIMGETAPSPGITIKGVHLRPNTATNTFWSHIRFRVGDQLGSENPDTWRAFSTKADYTVWQYCSFSWGIDINMGAAECNKALVYRCIISEGLARSFHSKGSHSKGCSLSKDNNQSAFVQCLMAHNDDRNPYLQSGTKAVVNNVVYNWHQMPIFAQWSTGQIVANIVGNVVIEGWNGVESVDQYAFRVWQTQSNSRFYVEGNRTEYDGTSYTQAGAEDWSVNVQNSSGNPDSVIKSITLILSAWPEGLVPIQVDKVKPTVLSFAGARPNDRDSVDIRIVKDVINGTGGIINSQEDVGGWPELAVNKITLDDLPSNPHGDDDGDGYTNIEEWLHIKSDNLLPDEVPSGFHPSAPGDLSLSAVSPEEIDLVWVDNSADEDGFRVYRATNDSDFLQVADLSTGKTFYQDAGLTASTTYYYRVLAYNNFGESQYISSNEETLEEGTGIGTVKAGNGKLSIHPCPVRSILHITCEEKLNGPLQISLYDMQGKLVYGTGKAVLLPYHINMESFVRGVYVAKITVQNATFPPVKVVKK